MGIRSVKLEQLKLDIMIDHQYSERKQKCRARSPI